MDAEDGRIDLINEFKVTVRWVCCQIHWVEGCLLTTKLPVTPESQRKQQQVFSPQSKPDHPTFLRCLHYRNTTKGHWWRCQVSRLHVALLAGTRVVLRLWFCLLWQCTALIPAPGWSGQVSLGVQIYTASSTLVSAIQWDPNSENTTTTTLFKGSLLGVE